MRIHTVLLLSAFAVACASEGNRTIQPDQVQASYSPYSGPRHTVSIGLVENRSGYGQGIFADGPDQLEIQARQILKNHLTQSQRFRVMDRVNMNALKEEAAYRGQAQKITGARYVLTGAVTEFGRRVEGGHLLWGLLGKGKTQVAYSKVSLSIVDTTTSEVVYSTQGAGEYTLSNAEVVGFGGTAGYDATLNDKVLNLSMMECVQRLAEGVDAGSWPPGGAQ